VAKKATLAAFSACHLRAAISGAPCKAKVCTSANLCIA